MNKGKNLVFAKDNHNIRIIQDENNELLFCLRDICENLEIQNNTDIKNAILREFEAPRLNLTPFQTQGGIQHFTMITEPQLYFVLMRSDKPKAREFRQWVINEVLPSIRKSGSYKVNELTNKDLQEENLRLKDELIDMQKEMIQTQKALIASLNQKATPYFKIRYFKA
ncbi:BRO-N domain-containing protein [Campylobacter upsaliensis]